MLNSLEHNKQLVLGSALVIVFVFLLCLFLYLFLSYAKVLNTQTNLIPTPTPTPNPTANPDSSMANWKPYRNLEYGFEFKLPTYLAEEFTGKNNEFIFSNSNLNNEKEIRALRILVSPTHEVDICKGAGTDFMGECRTINGHSALYMGSDYSEEEWRDSYNLIYKGNEISLSFYKSLSIETENQILSTFKFLDEANTDDPRTACLNANGKWLVEYSECESSDTYKGLNQVICTRLGGEYYECASACRHNPNAQVCTTVCIGVCKFK